MKVLSLCLAVPLALAAPLAWSVASKLSSDAAASTLSSDAGVEPTALVLTTALVQTTPLVDNAAVSDTPARPALHGVLPQPPSSSCPPCIQDLTGFPADDLFLYLPAGAYWEDPEWLAQEGVEAWLEAAVKVTRGTQPLSVDVYTMSLFPFQEAGAEHFHRDDIETAGGVLSVDLYLEADNGVVYDTPIAQRRLP